MVHDFFGYIRSGIFGKQLFVKRKAGFLGHLKYLLLNRIKSSGSHSLEAELYGSAITLKNLSIVQKKRPISADYIYEALMDNSSLLKPAYEELLTLYRGGKTEEAFATFSKRIGTRTGRNFAAILSKLDKLNPAELVQQMEVFQNVAEEERMTDAMRSAQRRSIITTAWASASVFALLINFAVVVVFMDTLIMLENLF